MNEFRLPMEYNWELAHKKIAKTEYYTLDLSATNVVQVSTLKGIIEITNVDNVLVPPAAGFGSATGFYINNPKLLLTEANKDNIYIQYSLYYKAGANDPVIPYVISTGVLIPNGVGFSLYNANPTTSITDVPWIGKLYVYFELYTK